MKISKKDTLDAITDTLRRVSDNYEDLGGRGRIVLTWDWPVEVTLGDKTFRSAVRVMLSEDGLKVADPDAQADRIWREYEAL